MTDTTAAPDAGPSELPRIRPLPYVACYGEMYDAAWAVLTAKPDLGISTTIHRLLAAVLPVFEREVRDTGPAVWVYLDGDGRLSAHAFATQAVCRDAAIGDYLTTAPVEMPGYTVPEFFWRPDGDDGAYDLMADGYPTCFTVHRLPVLRAPRSPGAASVSGSRAALEHLLEATLAPHAVVTSHGGQHWDVVHPAACDALPYGAQCLFDLARELRGYEQQPPAAVMFIGTPYIAHDHGPGDCERRDCPVLIRWSAAEATP